MFRASWWNRLFTSRELPGYCEIVRDPKKLSRAITESRTNGSSEQLRRALVSEGKQFIDDDQLTEARRNTLHCDPSRSVRHAALVCFYESALFAFSHRIYSRPIRRAIEEAVNDEALTVQTFAERYIKEFDRMARKKGLEPPAPTL